MSDFNNNNGKNSEGKVLNFHHITFWCGNAKMVATYFVTRVGFKPFAFREPTEDRPIVSYVAKLNKILLMFESPTSASEGEINKDLAKHGDFVKAVAFEVQNLDELMRRAKNGGAEVVQGITEEKEGDGLVRYAVLKTYGNNTHYLIEKNNYSGPFLPGFKLANIDDPLDKLLPDTNFKYIDHVEGNMADGTLEQSWSWYERNLNMHRFWCVDYKVDISLYSGIKSAAVINREETVLLSMNEAVKNSLRGTSKATEFVKNLGASSVEHVAFYTDDIIATMAALKSRGADILGVPPTYYDLIREKLKGSSVRVQETLEAMQENSVLIDFDERGYMLQAFLQHVQPRPTVFIEIVQRRNHRGFGAMNYKWVLEAIEMMETRKTQENLETEAAKLNLSDNNTKTNEIEPVTYKVTSSNELM